MFVFSCNKSRILALIKHWSKVSLLNFSKLSIRLTNRKSLIATHHYILSVSFSRKVLRRNSSSDCDVPQLVVISTQAALNILCVRDNSSMHRYADLIVPHLIFVAIIIPCRYMRACIMRKGNTKGE